MKFFSILFISIFSQPIPDVYYEERKNKYKPGNPYENPSNPYQSPENPYKNQYEHNQYGQNNNYGSNNGYNNNGGYNNNHHYQQVFLF